MWASTVHHDPTMTKSWHPPLRNHAPDMAVCDTTMGQKGH